MKIEDILFHLIMLLLIGALVFAVLNAIGSDCLYSEDASRCFPYNLPTWVKFSAPVFLVLSIIGLIFLIYIISKDSGENNKRKRK